MNLATSPKLLIAEDDDTTRDFYVAIMRQFRFTIATASDGQEAVDKAAEFKPDFAIMNFMMPKMDGVQAAIEIRRILPDCKIVFVTSNFGNPVFHDRLREFGAGDDLALPKPFRAPDLFRLLRHAGFPLEPVTHSDKLLKLLKESSNLK